MYFFFRFLIFSTYRDIRPIQYHRYHHHHHPPTPPPLPPYHILFNTPHSHKHILLLALHAAGLFMRYMFVAKEYFSVLNFTVKHQRDIRTNRKRKNLAQKKSVFKHCSGAHNSVQCIRGKIYPIFKHHVRDTKEDCHLKIFRCVLTDDRG